MSAPPLPAEILLLIFHAYFKESRVVENYAAQALERLQTYVALTQTSMLFKQLARDAFRRHISFLTTRTSRLLPSRSTKSIFWVQDRDGWRGDSTLLGRLLQVAPGLQFLEAVDVKRRFRTSEDESSDEIVGPQEPPLYHLPQLTSVTLRGCDGPFAYHLLQSSSILTHLSLSISSCPPSNSYKSLLLPCLSDLELLAKVNDTVSFARETIVAPRLTTLSLVLEGCTDAIVHGITDVIEGVRCTVTCLQVVGRKAHDTILPIGDWIAMMERLKTCCLPYQLASYIDSWPAMSRLCLLTSAVGNRWVHWERLLEDGRLRCGVVEVEDMWLVDGDAWKEVRSVRWNERMLVDSRVAFTKVCVVDGIMSRV